MLVVQLGGSGRGAGKTAVGCALVDAFPHLTWTVVKTTPHAHAESGSQATGAELSDTAKLAKDTDRLAKDTERYLSAGAMQAVLVEREAPLPQVTTTALLVEGNRVLATRPELYLGVVVGPVHAWKPSLVARLGDLDALVVTGATSPVNLPEPLRHLPVFTLAPGVWWSQPLEAIVRQRLEAGHRR